MGRCEPAGVLPLANTLAISKGYFSGCCSLYFCANPLGFLPRYRSRRGGFSGSGSVKMGLALKHCLSQSQRQKFQNCIRAPYICDLVRHRKNQRGGTSLSLRRACLCPCQARLREKHLTEALLGSCYCLAFSNRISRVTSWIFCCRPESSRSSSRRAGSPTCPIKSAVLLL